MPPWGPVPQLHKGHAVYQGDNVRDYDGDRVIFQELASCSSMMAASNRAFFTVALPKTPRLRVSAKGTQNATNIVFEKSLAVPKPLRQPPFFGQIHPNCQDLCHRSVCTPSRRPRFWTAAPDSKPTPRWPTRRAMAKVLNIWVELLAKWFRNGKALFKNNVCCALRALCGHPEPGGLWERRCDAHLGHLGGAHIATRSLSSFWMRTWVISRWCGQVCQLGRDLGEHVSQGQIEASGATWLVSGACS